MGVGLRAHFVATRHAVPLMVAQWWAIATSLRRREHLRVRRCLRCREGGPGQVHLRRRGSSWPAPEYRSSPSGRRDQTETLDYLASITAPHLEPCGMGTGAAAPPGSSGQAVVSLACDTKVRASPVHTFQ